MGLLVPAFLTGSIAIAVPILIHLVNRERRTVVEFPSLMFLQKVTITSVRQQRLRHLLLLALRCAALVLLAAAFARPFFPRSPSGTAVTGARELVVLLDRSWSMGYGDRFARAQDAARAAVRDIGRRDRATVVLFDIDASAVTEPTGEAARLTRAIDAATVGSLGTRYGPALRLAAQILEGSNLPRREVVVISDFQAAGRPRVDEARVPAGTIVRPVDVGATESPDVAVAAVTTDRERTSGQERVVVAARITNTWTSPRTVDATLELGGRAVETRRTTVPARGAAQVRFAPAAVPSGATRGVVRIGRDALAADDRFHFTVAADASVPVLIVEPATPRPNQSWYLARALEIGDRPSFGVRTVSASALTLADLSDRSLVVLNEVDPPGGALGARLRTMLQAGAGLLVVPGDARVDRWPAEWRTLLPASVGPVVDRSTRGGGILAALDFSHPVFEHFAGPRHGDFSTAHLYRYRTLTAAPAAATIARHDDGSPALVERALGSGKIVVWSSTLDGFWTDLPVQPVFLPFVRELATYAARYSDARPWFVAGAALDLSRHGELTAMFQTVGAVAADAELTLEGPRRARERLRVTGVPHSTTLREAGFHELRGPQTAVGSGRPIAVNVDMAEADFARLEPSELVAAVTAPNPGAPVPSAQPDAVASERRQTLWWYLLVLALALLVGETILSNRLSRTTV